MNMTNYNEYLKVINELKTHFYYLNTNNTLFSTDDYFSGFKDPKKFN